MKTRSLFTLAIAFVIATCLVAAVWAQPKMKMTTPIPESVSTPNNVQTSIGNLDFFDGVPSKGTVKIAYDFLDKVHGVKAFLSMIPSMSIYELREGQRSAGAKECY